MVGQCRAVSREYIYIYFIVYFFFFSLFLALSICSKIQ